MTTKQVTHSFQSVWDELVEKSYYDMRLKTVNDTVTPRYLYGAGASFTEKNLKHVPKVKALVEQVSSLLITCNGISFYARAPKAFDGASEDLQEMITTLYEKQCEIEQALKDFE